MTFLTTELVETIESIAQAIKHRLEISKYLIIFINANWLSIGPNWWVSNTNQETERTVLQNSDLPVLAINRSRHFVAVGGVT